MIKVSPSQETILATEDMLKSILGMEARERGFVISGGQAFLEPYRLGRKALAAAMERALKLTATDPERSPRLEKVRAINAGWRTRFLVEKMRGHIDCLSERGRGTIFFVELPPYASPAVARQRSDNCAVT